MIIEYTKKTDTEIDNKKINHPSFKKLDNNYTPCKKKTRVFLT